MCQTGTNSCCFHFFIQMAFVHCTNKYKTNIFVLNKNLTMSEGKRVKNVVFVVTFER